MVVRVAVFVDYQNMYKRARDAFDLADTEFHVGGQVRPVALGHMLCQGHPERTLTAVHMYRGVPMQQHNQKGHDAAQRQVAAWSRSGPDIVRVNTRSLNHRVPDAPREKGIDVKLAIDFVAEAMRGHYDLGIIFSDDTDLHPAIELVGEHLGAGHCVLAGWRDSRRSPHIVKSGGQNVAISRLNFDDYSLIKDTTDYTAPTVRPRRPPPPPR